MIFVMSTLLIGYTPPVAQGASVVITDAVQIVDGGSVNERMASMTSDSEGNIHVVWSRNTQHLYYSMLDPRAQTVIDVTQISNGGGHRAWHPDIDIDWGIRYEDAVLSDKDANAPFLKDLSSPFIYE